MFVKSGNQSRRSQQSPSFIDQIEITKEPRAEIARFLLAADAALHQKGVTLSVATFDDLLQVHAENRDTWPFLVPFFDPSVDPIDPANSAAFIAFNSNGEAIGTTAVRVWDFKNTTLKTEIEDLRFFYGSQANAWRERATCTVTAPIAAELNGRALYSGALWLRSDARGQNLAGLLPAISRFYALGRWQIDFRFSLGSKNFLRPEILDQYQFEGHQGDFFFTLDGQLRLKNYLLLWARTSFMLDELPALTEALNSGEAASPRLRHA